ncbi:MAG TPA: PAS domain-containing protein [Rubrobacter sp.]|nr:PAS domain-containing protein [Rubrobacter sp.]
MTPPVKKDQPGIKDRREAERLVALEYLRAVRPGVDHVLQELVDEVRDVFGTDLCMVNLNLSDVQYFRAWSGDLHPDLAEARQDAIEHSMCQYVVNDETPLVVEDFLATEEFREQYWHVNYGIRFYAGTPLITSAGHAIGTLCLLSARSVAFDEEQLRMLGAFARAVVGRLELLGALEREQTGRQEQTRRSQELQQTLDSLSAHIAILDETGEIIAVNDAWRTFAEANDGDPERVSEGVNYLEVCKPDSGSEEGVAFAEGIRAVLSGEREDFAMEYPCHSPTERRWFIGRVTRFSGVERSWAVVAHENITGRKLAEQALQDQKVLLETILGQAADAIVVCDDDGTFTFANAAARRMALRDPEGTTLEESTGVWGTAYYPEGRRVPSEESSMAGALRGETTVGRETRMVRPDGSHYDVLISAAPLKDSEGDIVGAVAGLLDITERKQAEQERDRLRAREIEVRTQREERRRIARDLHDVVLQDLSGTLQSLRLTHLRKDLHPEVDLGEELEALGRATSGLRSAIYDLRHEKKRPFAKSVESLVELSRHAAPGCEIGLSIEHLPAELPDEVGVELLRVLQEALINARRHSGARNVQVTSWMEGQNLLAEVTDDGRGFDPDSVRAGVGLSAMRERVERLGGEIRIHSRPGEGTRVLVRVPKEDDTQDP